MPTGRLRGVSNVCFRTTVVATLKLSVIETRRAFLTIAMATVLHTIPAPSSAATVDGGNHARRQASIWSRQMSVPASPTCVDVRQRTAALPKFPNVSSNALRKCTRVRRHTACTTLSANTRPSRRARIRTIGIRGFAGSPL